MNDDFDEENEKMNPFMAAGIFLGLIVVAAIVCVILWSVTHKNSDEPANATETVEEASEEYDNVDLATLETETADDEATEDQEIEYDFSDNETMESGLAGNETIEAPQSSEVSEIETEVDPISGTESMEFTEVSDTVTAKDLTNLRSVPSTLDSENVVAQLLNGDTLARTGVNDATGWSRLDYNGQAVYAVSGYLTTDLTYKPPMEANNPNRITTQDGRVIIFTDCDDYITPKEYVNLRIEPSTSQGETTVKCQIHHGDIVHRTGYSPDSGWSRVEYNGEILYVVSSFVYNKEATE